MSGPRVLVCEDEIAISRPLAFMLRDAGLEPLIASTLQDALHLLETEPLDAAVIDLILPDGDGAQVCRTLRAYSDMPIIVISATEARQGRDIARAAGADTFVAKPFSTRELIAQLRTRLAADPVAGERRPGHPGAAEHADRPPGSSLAGHWRAWRNRDGLDRLLIDGAPPDGTPELALRTRQLLRAGHREHIAAEIECQVALADDVDGPPSVADLCIDEVRVARRALLELADQLRRDTCLPRGVAMARRLLRDPESPLYARSERHGLWRAAREARRALHVSSVVAETA